ncbi:HEAT repeat domain-containing protein [Pseudomarimonas salicorniae]|uniref:HEAT repeat-containing protein n=1 Tax=Pseudomarimonas salicorniae TaxID=2933270 RepID=A0ABT0GG90_9GAMM|nr:hypothetical protein [Lysobacter sp. CAU 1642]MCK7593559.1 hypothetical protein [Lysobacter sp. CAU 1642]
MSRHLRVLTALFPGLVAGLFALPASAASLDALPDNGWVSWQVPSAAKGDGPCCYEVRGGEPSRRGCRLGKDDPQPTEPALEAAHGADGELVIYLKRKAGRSTALHALGGSCPVSLDGPLQALGAMDPARSIAFLDAQLEPGTDGLGRQPLLMAIAHHAEPSAARRLVARTAPGEAKAIRRDALFWLGQLHPAAGLDALLRSARSDPSREIRHHALFSLSQAEVDAARAALRDYAGDRSVDGEDRGQALFWLAQSGDPGARGAILAALRGGEDALIEQAVFALSQLGEGADEALIELVEGPYPRQARKRALFWLGQSGSKTALGYLDRVLAGSD